MWGLTLWESLIIEICNWRRVIKVGVNTETQLLYAILRPLNCDSSRRWFIDHLPAMGIHFDDIGWTLEVSVIDENKSLIRDRLNCAQLWVERTAIEYHPGIDEERLKQLVAYICAMMGIGNIRMDRRMPPDEEYSCQDFPGRK